MPAKNHLSPEQKEKLLKSLKESENPYIREKILILLLMNDGKTYQEISNFLEISYPTVAYWAVHGDPDNLDSLKDGRAEPDWEYEDRATARTTRSSGGQLFGQVDPPRRSSREKAPKKEIPKLLLPEKVWETYVVSDFLTVF